MQPFHVQWGVEELVESLCSRASVVRANREPRRPSPGGTEPPRESVNCLVDSGWRVRRTISQSVSPSGPTGRTVLRLLGCTYIDPITVVACEWKLWSLYRVRSLCVFAVCAGHTNFSAKIPGNGKRSCLIVQTHLTWGKGSQRHGLIVYSDERKRVLEVMYSVLVDGFVNRSPAAGGKG